jgi:F-type H+-transporting ATPase subunit alpha
MLKQKERNPLEVPDQVASIYAGTGGYLDRIKVDRVGEFLQSLLERLHSENEDLLKGIADDGTLSDEDEEKLGEAIRDFVDDFGPDLDEDGQPLEEGESDRVKSDEERDKPGRTEGDDDEDSSDDGSSDDDGSPDGDGSSDDDDAESEDAEDAEKEAAPA